MPPVLGEMNAKELAAATGLSERSIKAIRNARQLPRRAHRGMLLRAAADFTRARLRALGASPPAGHLAACAAYLAATRPAGG